jgi:hypothetical protein
MAFADALGRGLGEISPFDEHRREVGEDGCEPWLRIANTSA